MMGHQRRTERSNAHTTAHLHALTNTPQHHVTHLLEDAGLVCVVVLCGIERDVVLETDEAEAGVGRPPMTALTTAVVGPIVRFIT